MPGHAGKVARIRFGVDIKKRHNYVFCVDRKLWEKTFLQLLDRPLDIGALAGQLAGNSRRVDRGCHRIKNALKFPGHVGHGIPGRDSRPLFERENYYEFIPGIIALADLLQG